MGVMKTTIEIPDPLFRKVKSTAAERDQTLKEFFTEALQDKLASTRSATGYRTALSRGWALVDSFTPPEY